MTCAKTMSMTFRSLVVPLRRGHTAYIQHTKGQSAYRFKRESPREPCFFECRKAIMSPKRKLGHAAFEPPRILRWLDRFCTLLICMTYEQRDPPLYAPSFAGKALKVSVIGGPPCAVRNAKRSLAFLTAQGGPQHKEGRTAQGGPPTAQRV